MYLIPIVLYVLQKGFKVLLELIKRVNPTTLNIIVRTQNLIKVHVFTETNNIELHNLLTHEKTLTVDRPDN